MMVRSMYAKRKQWKRMHVQGTKPLPSKPQIVGSLDLAATSAANRPVWAEILPSPPPVVIAPHPWSDSSSAPCPNCGHGSSAQSDEKRTYHYCQQCGHDWRVEAGTEARVKVKVSKDGGIW